ncbi:MAG: ATP-binding cassette domain-containing protein [Promicromonosporaceae bacterium]|nr:ATP-binding cassette domain-containing protein [Promicromonosporaceae bacterium]
MVTLAVENLYRTFGKTKALDGVTFEVNSGEIFGFVGSNGAGKTTTMRIIMGVLAPDSGSVLWDGKPITHQERSHIGYMPEERGLYPKMHVGAQLTYLARLQGLSPAAAKKAAHDWADRLGIGSRMKDEVQKLSLGNQQRVQLAAALVASPQALILDEPFSGLDPVAVEVMSSVLQERAAAGVPVIFSSHQLDLVERISNRVGIISAGRMVAVGTIEQLRATDRPQWTLDGAHHTHWASRLPNAKVIATGPTAGGFHTIIETQGGDGQEVLAAALTAGPVREFSQNKPHLTDLYRHVVQTDTNS